MKIAGYKEPTHPIRGDALDQLERHLWRFRIVCLESSNLMRGYRTTPDVAATINQDLLFSLANQATLLVCKFLEVWDSFGAVARTHRRVVEVRRCVQPIVDRIRQWEDLDVFRDSVLAHTYETSDGKLISPQYILEHMLVPGTHAEVILLLDLVNYAVIAILCGFRDEYLALRDLFSRASIVPSAQRGISRGTELDAAVRAVLFDVDQKLAAAGIDISGPVAEELASGAGHRRHRPAI